jgi:hypothetical protein
VNISIAPGDFMELTDSTAETREDLPAASMGSPHRMPSPAPILAHSADSIMEEPHEDFPHAGNRASGEDSTEVAASTEVVAVTAAAVTADSFHYRKRKLEHGEQNYAHY